MLPEFKEDMRALETLKTLMIYSRCLYKFEAGSLSLKKNYDGQLFRSYAWLLANRRLFGV